MVLKGQNHPRVGLDARVEKVIVLKSFRRLSFDILEVAATFKNGHYETFERYSSDALVAKIGHRRLKRIS